MLKAPVPNQDSDSDSRSCGNVARFGLSKSFTAEILAGGITPFTDHGHPRDNFSVQLPGALSVVFAQLCASLCMCSCYQASCRRQSDE